MPEATIDPLSTPAPADVAKTGGIDAMMANLDAADIADQNPPASPVVPAEPKEPVAPEPEPEPEPQPEPEPAKPAAKPADAEMSVEDMEKFLKAHPNKKPWKIYESLKTTTAGKVAELEAKLKALESKPNEAPGDAAKVALLEKQIEALTGETTTYKQRLAETEFRHTPQFAAFRDRGGRLLSKGHQLISGMKFTEADGTERSATKEDFDFFRALPAGKRGDVAKAALGDFNAYQIAALAGQIDDLREESDLAADEFSKSHEMTALQKEQVNKANATKYATTVKTEMDNLRKDPKNGRWFSPDEKDPEITKVLNDSFAKVEEMVNGSANATLEQVAANSALLRSQAAAFPRVVMENGRLEAKVKALEAELVKFRGSDPGAKGAAAPGGTAPARRGGIDEVTATFDSDPSLFNGRR